MKNPAVVIVAILLVTSAFAFAQPPRDTGRDRTMGQRDRLNRDLRLTDEQESQMKKLHLELERKQTQTRTKVQLARLDMKEMYLSDNLNRTALEKSLKQVSELQMQMKMNFVDFWFSVNGILTPEQQKIWKNHLGEMAEEMGERMRERMQHRGPMIHQPPEEQD